MNLVKMREAFDFLISAALIPPTSIIKGPWLVKSAIIFCLFCCMAFGLVFYSLLGFDQCSSRLTCRLPYLTLWS